MSSTDEPTEGFRYQGPSEKGDDDGLPQLSPSASKEKKKNKIKYPSLQLLGRGLRGGGLIACPSMDL